MAIDLEMEALHELKLNQWRYTDMGKPHVLTHHGKSRPNGKTPGQPAKVGPDWVHRGMPVDEEVSQHLFNLNDLADDMERGELRDVAPEVADTLDRLSQSLKEQGEEDYRILCDVLPKLHQTQMAIDELNLHYRKTLDALESQYEEIFAGMSEDMIEKANDYLRVDDTIYRLTLQEQIIGIDVSEVKDITDFHSVDEQIHDHEKDNF